MVLAILCLVPGQAQAQNPLVGTWKLNYVAGSRIENGSVRPLTATGTLRVEARGDSLIGELVTDPIPDVPDRPAAQLAGLARNGEVMLVGRSTGSLTINGEQRPIVAVSTWRLQARGDSVTGAVTRHLEGLPFGGQGPDPVSGARQRR